tara:strand:+ start:925 stop:1992 length:1068 start_codon:yes stop_codon:yes gene_type:complete
MSSVVIPKNIKIMNMSPKTFLKECLYESINVDKKRKKVSMEDFEIPSYSSYDKLLKINYNVSQLKSACRFYKQRVSGNKKELIFLLYNYLKFSNSTIKIQKAWRGYLRRYLNNLRGPGLSKKCVNETDFYTLEDIKELDISQFYSFIDKDDKIYGFDICSLYNMIVKEKQFKNPYNRNELPVVKMKSDMKKILKIGKILNEKPNIKLSSNFNELSQEKQFELRTIDVFQKIDENGFITNVKWYLNLSRQQLKRFIRELLDIWQYRAQISNHTKRKINPQHGNPFFTINMTVLMHKCFEVLQKRILDIIEIFITQGEDTDSRSLGTYYVLGALTTVSQDAAISLPWLYESFVPNQQ